MKKVLVLTRIIDETINNYKNALNNSSIEYTVSTSFLDETDFDGLLITGGSDIDPSFYGEERSSELEETFIEYDEICFKEIDSFYKANKPILGICRGMQLINVYFKGSLNQHILNHKLNDEETHTIDISKNSFLYELYGSSTIVNSIHHQSIKRLGYNLDVITKSSDGVIEGIISKDNKIIGVQWHPERMIKNYSDKYSGQKIFDYFKTIL